MCRHVEILYLVLNIVEYIIYILYEQLRLCELLPTRVGKQDHDMRMERGRGGTAYILPTFRHTKI